MAGLGSLAYLVFSNYFKELIVGEMEISTYQYRHVKYRGGKCVVFGGWF